MSKTKVMEPVSHLAAQVVYEKITVALRGTGYLAGWFGSTARNDEGSDIDVMVVQADRAAHDPLRVLSELSETPAEMLRRDPRVTFETWRLLVNGHKVDVHLQDAVAGVRTLERPQQEARA